MVLTKSEYSKAKYLVKTLNMLCSKGKSSDGPFGVQKSGHNVDIDEKGKKKRVHCSFFFALPQFGIRLELSKLPKLDKKSP